MWDRSDPVPAAADVLPAIWRLAVSALRSGLKALVPRGLSRAYRAYGSRGALDYLRRGRTTLPSPFAPRSVLFVCSGNIMRSALAAAVFRAALLDAGIKDIEIESGGLYAAAGTPADPRALAAARLADLDLEPHRARLVNDELAGRFDAIFVMDRLQALELLQRFPAARGKTFALGACLPGLPRIDISDPYLSDDEESARILSLVASRAVALARTIAPGPSILAAEQTPQRPREAPRDAP